MMQSGTTGCCLIPMACQDTTSVVPLPSLNTTALAAEVLFQMPPHAKQISEPSTRQSQWQRRKHP